MGRQPIDLRAGFSGSVAGKRGGGFFWLVS